MILYYCQEEKHKNKEGERLIGRALNDYLKIGNPQPIDEKVQMDIADTVILRGHKGKPFFKEYNVEFSVSHTEQLWVCLMADYPVGVDVQKRRTVNRHAVAKRFFTKLEQEYIHEFGEIGFFDVWCRKEAYVKYTGKGFADQGFSTFSVVDEQLKLTEHIDGIWVHSLDFSKESAIGTQIAGAFCTQKKEELWIKRL
ncbi:4'-phosphopantetheinyl transferase family protein [Clostridium aminobutyricum]|uniref:4'-phosphopantetheinyl transferase superfamily protein n=1 Tax=Clostridium aminobutyricum TaxID=33953 RepID=A0A939IH01_CLOAM|nr:4'-phosphopantetheinyl transferase superfamily protein [Clostridium aminobutyricum]MBN7772872.1 4'-phosphopantetheinyl transferase superfamily protein [Clostridium aminobutyricum]